MSINPLQPPIPRDHDTQWQWGPLAGSAAALAIANLSLAQQKLLLLITTSVSSAEKAYREITFFVNDATFPVYVFPDWETLPYDHFSPHEDIVSERLQLLYRLPIITHGIVIVALPAIMQRLAPCAFIQTNSCLWSVGDCINLTAFKNQLSASGYHCVEQVMQHGEFSVRGGLIDLFPMGSNAPYRIELFDDIIDTIRLFDPDTQCSIKQIKNSTSANSLRVQCETLKNIHLLPAHEFPLDDNAITRFRQNWRAQFSGNPTESPIYQHISQGKSIGGIEYYLPLFFEKTGTMFDYLPNHTQCILLGDLSEKANQHWHDIETRYEQFNVDTTRPLCPPNQIFIPVDQLFSKIKQFLQIKITQTTETNLPDITIDHRKKNPLESLGQFINTMPGKILICAESSGRREIISELFQQNHIPIYSVDSWTAFLNSAHAINITICAIENALWLPLDKLIVLTETQLLGQSFTRQTRHTQKRVSDPNAIIRSLAELQIGALVVHLDHGIGKYEGLERITTDSIEAEYLTLTYSGGDRIYVPISSLHLINRYAGGNNESVSLNKLGTQQWEKIKQKAAQQIRDVAAELLKIYAARQTATGFSFPKPTDEFIQFRRSFPFEETPDQRQAIDAVIADMTHHRCMDRLICGDVGFGKTEIAMQAAFLAVQANKQVAVLVPTTLLANQHTENFQNRFSDWPIKIATLSRFQTNAHQKEVIEKLKTGQIDIVIGTHKLFNERVRFKELGLLIIDEEHRFGVRQKERIKAMRAQVDILTLTATPIPRTLNMSMTGMRDLSIIATPPSKRLSIKTFLHEYDAGLIKEAIVREVARGGQVYFLHNDIDTIDGVADQLRTWLPNVKIAIGHGKMSERQLEKTMADFYHQRFDVLVCTTIIESGIDIPTANTMIINQANQFGLAQLHQIRGRVGRSHHQAYAYLLVQNQKNLNSDAKKRLQALTQFDALGMGFQLATQDLEIRGAGELLGESQSGHIESIGFALYMELLEETMSSLKIGGHPPSSENFFVHTDIDLRISALLPENYVRDVHTRLILYKRLAECQATQEIDRLKSELIDRFGLLPEAAKNLFAIAQLKIQAKKIGIRKIDTQKTFGYLHFYEKPNVNPEIIIQLIQNERDQYRLTNATTLRFTLPSESAARITTVTHLLTRFQ